MKQIKLSQLQQNKGQIPGLPSNPRRFTDAEIERLAQSIEETPELLKARSLIVVKHEKFQSTPLHEGRRFQRLELMAHGGFNPRPYMRGD